MTEADIYSIYAGETGSLVHPSYFNINILLYFIVTMAFSNFFRKKQYFYF